MFAFWHHRIRPPYLRHRNLFLPRPCCRQQLDHEVLRPIVDDLTLEVLEIEDEEEQMVGAGVYHPERRAAVCPSRLDLD